MDLSPMKNKSRSEQVAQQILSMIADGILHEGDKLPSEPEFAKQLGISRGILREGLAQLKAQGVIRRKPKDGTYILPLAGNKDELAASTRLAIQASSFRNIMEMRSAIEQKAAALAVDRATDEELEQLRKTVLEPQIRSGEDDLDFFFHYRLVELSGNSIFMDIVNTYFKEIRQIRDSNLKDASYVQQVNQEHLAIIDAICRRDKDAAQIAVERHMERIWDRWRLRNLDGAEET
jgi:GntR family transcriptional repressor for pyruvate dehydrogenase complex